jgi:D-alanyl-D-alanine carboxypeptidase/D-alanyl-D-alanine-endopeptidase (penicillin-binding protein 4)
VDGTLAKRFRGYGDSQVVRAKTGTLNGVDSLSGLVLKPHGHGAVAFSLLVDGVAGRHAEARERMDAVVVAIAEENRKAAQP